MNQTLQEYKAYARRVSMWDGSLAVVLCLLLGVLGVAISLAGRMPWLPWTVGAVLAVFVALAAVGVHLQRKKLRELKYLATKTTQRSRPAVPVERSGLFRNVFAAYEENQLAALLAEIPGIRTGSLRLAEEDNRIVVSFRRAAFSVVLEFATKGAHATVVNEQGYRRETAVFWDDCRAVNDVYRRLIAFLDDATA